MMAIVVTVVLAALLGSASGAEACTGDCSSDGLVTVDEIIQGVNIALGLTAVTQCEAFDTDGGGSVTVDEVVTAVNNALSGCPRFAPGEYAATILIDDQIANVLFTVDDDGDIDGQLTLTPATGSAAQGEAGGSASVSGSVDLNTGQFSIAGVVTLPGQPPIAFSMSGTLPSSQGGGSISIMIGSQTYTGSFNNTPTPTPTPPSVQHEVKVGQANLPFDPEVIEINPGETVVWTWVGGTHSVRSAQPGSPGLPNCTPDGRFDSGAKSSGTFSYTFTAPGSYEYHCGVGSHCQSFESGIVIVRGTPTQTPTATSTRTPLPPSTPTATATADVVDGVSRGILGIFSGEYRNQFGGVFEARLQIEQSGFAQVRVTDIGGIVLGVFGQLTLMAETPTRIVFLDPDPFNMRSLTLELVGPGHLTGTHIVGSQGMGTFTSTLDLMRETGS
jgi:plastocyanin